MRFLTKLTHREPVFVQDLRLVDVKDFQMVGDCFVGEIDITAAYLAPANDFKEFNIVGQLS